MALVIPHDLANLIPADGADLQANFSSIESYINSELIDRSGTVAMVNGLLLPGAPTTTNQAANKGYVDGIVPVGSMQMYAGGTEPTNYMFCRGQAIARGSFAALFTAIGTAYGVGDGSTTFNLPNMQATVPVGHNTNTNPPAGLTGKFTSGLGERTGSTDTSLPDHVHTPGSLVTGLANLDHTHTLNWGEVWQSTAAPADNVNVFAVRIGDGITINIGKFSSNLFPTTGFSSNHQHGMSGVTANAGINPSNTNIQPSLTVNYIIKVT